MQGAQTDLFAGVSEATSQVAVPTADPTTAAVPSSTSEPSTQAPPTTATQVIPTAAFSSTTLASSTTTPAPAQTTSLSKVCRRSQPGRHPLVNYARRARRNTRAARARLAVEQMDKKRLLEDRRALYARGLELMHQGKA
jgi:hypothetical protein